MICIPVSSQSQEEALNLIARSIHEADAIELRMDLIEDGKLPELIEAVRAGARETKIIVTNRKKEGSDEQKRLGVLMDAVNLGVDYVDIELDTDAIWKDVLLSAVAKSGNKTKLIVSHHDHEKTPPIPFLQGVLNECFQSGAHIAKIVTFAHALSDNIAVLNLISHAANKQKDVIAFCMGEQGRPSRVMAPIVGSIMSFATLEKGLESAPGQLTVEEMKQIFSIFRGTDQNC